MCDDLFDYIINDYCYQMQIDSWWDLTEVRRLKFFQEYIEPYVTVKDATYFYQTYVL